MMLTTINSEEFILSSQGFGPGVLSALSFLRRSPEGIKIAAELPEPDGD